MKKIIILGLLLLASVLGVQAQKQKPVTEALKVQGNCEHCKERIEAALDIKGVIHAEWDARKGEAMVTYKPQLVSRLQLLQAVQKSGHDTDSLKASDSVYATLPECCKYRKPVKP